MVCPGKEHWQVVKCILRYLKSTTNVGLTFDGAKMSYSVVGYVDLDFAGDLDKRRSLIGYLFTLSGSANSWKATLQVTVALSTTNRKENGRSGDVGGRSFIDEYLGWLLKIKVVEELMLLGKIAFPMAISSLLLHSKSIISMLFLGHLGHIELAGGSLAIGFANVTGYSLIKGLAMGMEPMCCQAYGAKKWAILSQTYKKTLCILFLATIPISLLWLYMEPILLWSGQDQNVTSIARVYITYSIPELLAQAHLLPLRIFMRTQNLTKPVAIGVIFATILHFPINYLLIIHLNLGVKGVALASFWNTINLSLGLLAYLILSRTAIKPWRNKQLVDTYNERTFNAKSSETHMESSVIKCQNKTMVHTISFIEGWQPLIALMLPSVLSVCLEWWWYEIMLLLCGLQDNPQASVAAIGILIQATGLLYVVPYSLSTGLSTRVGQELGAGHPSQARRATIVGLIVSFICGLLTFAFTISVKDWWGKMYTKEQQILDLTSLALP
ncbi:hypothetical protein GH714_014316 [Hevea brasiliensis]|uniref:Protein DETOXIFICATION n=1 Tax=Hevea brasiliensis TaxID=3981 RepID=A0A6A6N458_HEVBR|nr:hypothetical protein GH714_014316 [Hevea brasiliensis]